MLIYSRDNCSKRIEKSIKMPVEACLLSQKEFNLLWMKHDETKIQNSIQNCDYRLSMSYYCNLVDNILFLFYSKLILKYEKMLFIIDCNKCKQILSQRYLNIENSISLIHMLTYLITTVYNKKKLELQLFSIVIDILSMYVNYRQYQ